MSRTPLEEIEEIEEIVAVLHMFMYFGFKADDFFDKFWNLGT
jgi:hypothetical protein